MLIVRINRPRWFVLFIFSYAAIKACVINPVNLPNSDPLSPRRQFLKTGMATTGATILGFPAIVSARSPNSRLNLACIGVGGRGIYNTEQMARKDNIATICDVNTQNLAAAQKRYPKARPFTDFRKLYDAGINNIDGVVVSVPEHTHAFATLPALLEKKHVFCEKPLTRDIHESRLISRAAAIAGVKTQMGINMHAKDNYRRGVELIRSNAIGPVSEVHVWVDRAWGWQSPEDAEKYRDIASTQDRPKGSTPRPDHLDWDLWIGPAPMRPFHEIYFPGPKWYRWWDFGNGTMSDLGSHWHDLPFWALELDAPRTVKTDGPPPHPEIAPASMTATYAYGSRGNLPPVTLTWYQGNRKPRIWHEKKIPQWKYGTLFVGTQGRMILTEHSEHLLLPEKEFKDFEPPPQTIPNSIGHHAEWIEACKGGAETTCPFSYSGPLTEACHLGNVAYRAGRKIQWDAGRMKIPNAPEAEQFLKRSYREGWSLG